jgi:hypothetical protein
MASQCFVVGRIKEAVGYSDIGESVIAAGGDTVPYDAAESWLDTSYLYIGQTQRSVELCRAQLYAVVTPIQSPGQASYSSSWLLVP